MANICLPAYDPCFAFFFLGVDDSYPINPYSYPINPSRLDCLEHLILNAAND